jgi:hypothetical protein
LRPVTEILTALSRVLSLPGDILPQIGGIFFGTVKKTLIFFEKPIAIPITV